MAHLKATIGDIVRFDTLVLYSKLNINMKYIVQDITVSIRIKSGEVSYTYLLGNCVTGETCGWTDGDNFTIITGDELATLQRAIDEYNRVFAKEA
jgi:hypothetical protein